MDTIFHSVEHAILCDYFGEPRPKYCHDIDITRPPIDEPSCICLIDVEYANEHALKNAVARIALEAIQNRLPNCAVFSADEGMVLCREQFSHPNRPVELLPIPLFTINWADTAPGISWPESYHATFIPGFGRYVVTAAMDSPETHGYTELAIGWFPEAQDIKAGAHEVIVAWWRWQYDSWGQSPWAYVWNEDLISEDAAEEWAGEIWTRYVANFAEQVVTLLSPDSDSADRSEALVYLKTPITEHENIYSRRSIERAYAAMERCLNTVDLARDNLLDIIDAVGDLRGYGHPFVPELLRRLEVEESQADLELRLKILAAIDAITSRDKTTLQVLGKRLLDCREHFSVRWWSARILYKVTGLDEFKAILHLPAVNAWREGIGHAGPWGGEIRAGRDWDAPRPDRFQKQLGARCLKAMAKELGEPSQSSAPGKTVTGNHDPLKEEAKANSEKTTGATATPITEEELQRRMEVLLSKGSIAGPDDPIYKGGLVMTSIRRFNAPTGNSQPSTEGTSKASSSVESEEPDPMALAVKGREDSMNRLRSELGLDK